MNVGLLYKILRFTEKELLQFLLDTLPLLGYEVLTNDNDYIVAIPIGAATTPIALVAHIDTVPRNGVSLVRSGVLVKNALGVLGADDRAGVYALVELAQQSSLKPVLIFTSGEELGGVGARVLVSDGVLDSIKNTVSLFIELDREGVEDYVFYSCDIPSSVTAWARQYGFKQAEGAYSDVAEFSKATSIPHLNLSTGYYNRHTENEYLDLSVLAMTITRVKAMIEEDRVPRGVSLRNPLCLASSIAKSRRQPVIR